MQKLKRMDIIFPIIMLLIFIFASTFMYLKTSNQFYLFDLPYIGISISVCILLNSILSKKNKQYARRTAQLLIGLYLVFFIGLYMRVNMQIEGFFFYLFAGVFAGATLHFSVAKIFGPAIFGRGWCGWACWTAMVLDFLPWKENLKGRLKYWGIFRYIHFVATLILTSTLFYVVKSYPEMLSVKVIYWVLIGNLFYYLTSIIMAFILKDNRAFCKYLCPIPPIQKLLSGFAIFKLGIDNEKCNECGLCEVKCPMNIKILEYKKAGKRILSKECILCTTCYDSCPKNAFIFKAGFDFEFKEHIEFMKK